MPLATFRHASPSPASAHDIWDALQSAETWGGIGLIDSVSDEQLGEDDGLRSFAFVTSAGGRTWEGTARTVTAVPDERMELSLITKEIRARISLDLTPEGDQTLVSARLEAEPAGMLATLFWGVVRETISSGFAQQVDAFAAEFGA